MLGLTTRLRTRARFFANLAVTLEAGLAADRALATLADPDQSDGLATAALATVRRGGEISEGLAARQGTCEDFELAAIAAGEASGQLPSTLERLSRAASSRADALDRAIRRLLYPAVLAHGAILLPPLHLLVRGGPGIYLGAVLPWLAVFWGFVGMVFVLARRRLESSHNKGLGQLLLSLPILGQAVRSAAVARYAHALGVMVGSGAPLLQSLEHAAQAASNATVREAGHRAMERVRGGWEIYRALAEESSFPRLFVEATRVGEESGRLEETLEKAGESLRQDAESALARVAALLTGLAWTVAVLSVLRAIFGFWSSYAGLLERVGSQALL